MDTGFIEQEAKKREYKESFEATSVNSRSTLEEEIKNTTEYVEQMDTFVFDIEASQMTQKEKDIAYQQAADRQFNVTDRSQKAKNREEKNRRKNADKASAQNMRKAKLLREQADKMADATGAYNAEIYENPTVERAKSFAAGKDLPAADVKRLKDLKKVSHSVFQRYTKYSRLYRRLIGKDNAPDSKLMRVVRNQYKNAALEWEKVRTDIDRICKIPESEVPEEEKKRIEKQRLDSGTLRSERYCCIEGSGFTANYEKAAIDEEVEAEIKVSLEKHTIDWDKSIDQVIAQYEAEIKSYEGKEDSKSKRMVSGLRKKIGDMEVERYIRPKVYELVEKKRKEGIEITPKQVEEKINKYLETVANKASLRFRASAESTGYILTGRNVCAEVKEYNELRKKMYDPMDLIPTTRGNITFGYLGGNSATECVGYLNPEMDKLQNYGSISIKLRKDKVKDRTGFVCGNSLYNYDRERARSIEHPDILAVDGSLEKVYERAVQLDKNGGEMFSAEQEALETINDRTGLIYFEAQYLGKVGAAEIEELTYIYKGDMTDKVNGIIEDTGFINLYNDVKMINSNPSDYEREEGAPEIKISVWDSFGHEMSWEDVKFKMEAK